MLTIYAGETAKQHLLTHGFRANDFSQFLGASGGPKWFSLFGLDRYLFGQFFANRQKPLNLIGSSAGAFRSACFAQAKPVDAIERLAHHYVNTVYSEKPTAAEITDKARALLDIVVPESGVDEIINNPVFKAHFIVAKVNGLASSENRLVQMVGLVKSMLTNRASRRLLKGQYERFIFAPENSQFHYRDPDSFRSATIPFTPENLKPALLASGSIPLVMQGIENIAGAPEGMYRDGGIIDYHFDLNIDAGDGLILYPHFNASPRAGWFDKSLPRKVRNANYDKTVMLVPSAEFVASLPYSKIPDREDFSNMDAEQRIAYWNTVLDETERLAKDFDNLVNNGIDRPIFPVDSI